MVTAGVTNMVAIWPGYLGGTAPFRDRLPRAASADHPADGGRLPQRNRRDDPAADRGRPGLQSGCALPDPWRHGLVIGLRMVLG
jgi:hypothetical protein